MSIHFVITGGTIDSFYDGMRDAIVPLETSVIPEFIGGLKLGNGAGFTQVCMKDSRGLTRDDLNAILRTVEESSANKVIITHGTYTMPDTARFLKAHATRTDQVVVLTGSMVPIKGFAPSDGPFNLGYAVATVHSHDPGIYLCMNGTTFAPEEVAKLISEGRFVSLFT